MLLRRKTPLALLLACACAAQGETRAPVPAPSDYTETIRGSDVAFDMVWIPAGGFWIGRSEVTWDEYLSYCDFELAGAVPPGVDAVSKPSKPLDWAPFDHDWGAGRRPALGMSWNAAREYCRWLSLNTGREYRLPSEEEWQLAAGRGGEGPLYERAWFDQNSGGKTQEVGRKAANENGLYDVLGNLWEYCAGPWSRDEPGRAVLRGGSWQDPPETLTPGARLAFDDDWTLEDPSFPPGVWWVPGGAHLGLRVLRPGPEDPEREAP